MASGRTRRRRDRRGFTGDDWDGVVFVFGGMVAFLRCVFFRLFSCYFILLVVLRP